MKVHDFIAAFITDETLKERVLYVFSTLPEDAQKEFMQDPGFSIGTYDTGRSGGVRLLLRCPQVAQDALLWNRGRHPGEDPEVAADSLAAAWGFPRPATLPLLIPLTQPLPRGERRRRR